MARDRARSSFTVEVRRGRSTPIETDPKRSLWRGLDLAGEAARHDGVPQAVAPQAPMPRPAAPPQARELFAARAPTPSREAPRILPSLIQAPAPVEEEAPAPEREEKLPRVRRARIRTAAPEPVQMPDPDEVFTAADEDPEAEAVVEPVAGEPIRLRRRTPRGADRVLRAGERWKRRLPRALW